MKQKIICRILADNIAIIVSITRGAGSVLRQGGGANRAKGASRAPEANRGLLGQIAGSGGKMRKKGILPCLLL